jgi:hypothetical protein
MNCTWFLDLWHHLGVQADFFRPLQVLPSTHIFQELTVINIEMAMRQLVLLSPANSLSVPTC